MATRKYKTKMNRLKSIVETMEKGDLELEKAMAYFEEGMALVGECQKDLDRAEEKVTILTQEGEKIFEGEDDD
ncbi:MAG: exodeoxyribonuclease VII small subunit [Eubacteriaceae bacterium]|jgi:exodeoxyribonuclease VII small subunit|nr:exodeoxyribonuclease VII small subunit [Eubacteriaceae bacterium]MDD4507391.1 exodeoxyribonuclease VII small subunit [Eubacteriaceae bacterium]